MVKKPLILLGLALPVLALQSVRSAEEARPARYWIPEQAVIVLEVSDPGALLDPLLGQEMRQAVTSLPAYEAQLNNPKFSEFQGIIAHLENRLETNWRAALQALVGGGMTFAVGPHGETLLTIDARDKDMLEELHQVLLGFARGEAEKQGRPQRVASKEYRGTTGWTFGTNEAHAIVGNRLLLSNRPEVLRAVLDLGLDGTGGNIASSADYLASRKALENGAAATAYVNMQVLRQHPAVKRAVGGDANPLAALLFAGVREALRDSQWLALGLYVRDGKLTLKARTDAVTVKRGDAASFAVPSRPDDGVLPNLNVAHGIAGVSLFRDLHGFYAAKDELFPERTSGLIFFENMMGIFFSGLDLTEEVLGETLPEIRLVAAGQEYDPATGKPEIQIPAFAAVLRLRHPGKFGEVVEEAWQKAIGLSNFTRGQKALPGLIIDRFSHGDETGTVAYFRPPAGTQQVSSRYNYRPALARPDEYLIISSTDGLARTLIDELKKEKSAGSKALPRTHSLVELDGNQLLAILLANREPMIRKNMIDKGNSREQAGAEFDLMMTLLTCLRHARLELGEEGNGAQAALDLQLRVPDPKRIRTSDWSDVRDVSRAAAVAEHGSGDRVRNDN